MIFYNFKITFIYLAVLGLLLLHRLFSLVVMSTGYSLVVGYMGPLIVVASLVEHRL